jgi:hypothetical protein
MEKAQATKEKMDNLVEEGRNSNNIISFKSDYLKLGLVQSVP